MPQAGAGDDYQLTHSRAGAAEYGGVDVYKTLPKAFSGRRVPSFEDVKSICVQWARDNQDKYRLPDESIETLANCQPDAAGKRFVRNSLQAIALKADPGSELADWYRTRSDYALCKLFDSV